MHRTDKIWGGEGKDRSPSLNYSLMTVENGECWGYPRLTSKYCERRDEKQKKKTQETVRSTDQTDVTNPNSCKINLKGRSQI